MDDARLTDLSQEAFRAAERLRRVLPIAHLDAGQCEAGAMLGADLYQRIVAVPAGRVVVARRQLRRVAARPVPPVDARHLQRHFHPAPGRHVCWDARLPAVHQQEASEGWPSVLPVMCVT